MTGLVASGVTVRLGGRRVLDAVDLALRPGEVTAIVGPNGAGKTTLITCLAGLRHAGAGQVTLGGRPIGAISDRERARLVGYLPQSPEVAWRLDVHTFVRLGRTAHRGLFGETAADAEAVDTALESTAMTPFADRDIATLSGGERARALMARALAGEPSWLQADLSHQLDAANLLQRIAGGGVGVVVSVHDLSFAARAADRVLVMAEGRILADGAPMAALSPAVLARAYAVDASWIDGVGGPVLDVVRRHD